MTHTTKHTPGPWAVEGDNNGYMIVGSGQCYIADICASDGLVNENDAALIAAAPAMYEALKALHSVLDQRMPDGRTLNQHLSQEVFECFYGPAIAARAAIAKAEGA